MDTTSVSLLHRLREPDQEAAWERFVKLYAPLIFHWGKSQSLSVNDAGDLVQDVMAFLLVHLRKFDYDPQQRFRGWLRTVTVNKARDLHRRNSIRRGDGHEEAVQQFTTTSNVDLFEEAQYRSFLVQRARRLIESDFDARTWQACWMQVTEGCSASDVGRELGMNANAVRVAKCRVLRRLREELTGLID